MPKKKQGMTLLNVEIPLELKERIDEYCAKNGVKIKFLVTRAIEEYLQKHLSE
jgi:predicted DNA-binding protein